jgi:PTS system ascorbate-specific IIA component
MSVALVLVTHGAIGAALLDQARLILDAGMSEVVVYGLDDTDRDHESALGAAMRGADRGAGVLVLTDLPGATPCNLAVRQAGDGAHVVSGLNLPMLIRAWNYRDRPLDELTELAMEGGCNAIRRSD